jgi:hypothetical protein
VPDPFLETHALGLRSEGRRDAVRAAYEMQFFSAFPDVAPADEGMALGDDTVVVWGMLRGTSRGDWLGVLPGGGAFAVPFANVVPFRDGRMVGEIIYFDLATLCEQARIPLKRFGPPQRRAGPEPAWPTLKEHFRTLAHPSARSPDVILSIRPFRSTYTSSTPFTMTSVMFL